MCNFLYVFNKIKVIDLYVLVDFIEVIDLFVDFII